MCDTQEPDIAHPSPWVWSSAPKGSGGGEMRQINIQVLTHTDQGNKPTYLTLNLIQTHLETIMPQHASLAVSQEKESTKKQKTLIPGKGKGRVLALRRSSQPIDLLFPQGILTLSTTLINDCSLPIQERNSESEKF